MEKSTRSSASQPTSRAPSVQAPSHSFKSAFLVSVSQGKLTVSSRASHLQVLSQENRILSVGPEFILLGKVDADFALSNVGASVKIAYDLSEVETTFPPHSGSTGGSFNQGTSGAFPLLSLASPPSHALILTPQRCPSPPVLTSQTRVHPSASRATSSRKSTSACPRSRIT